MEKCKKSPECLNCGYAFKDADNYCPDCGQPNYTHRRPVHHFASEFFEDLLNLDARFFVTLRDLLIKPGLLTKNYNKDWRVRYTPPLRFYVLTSILFFLSLSYMTNRGIQEADSKLQQTYAENDSLFSNSNLNLTWGSVELGPEEFAVLEQMDAPLTTASIDSAMTKRGIETSWWDRKMIQAIAPIVVGGFSLEEFYGKMLQNFSYALFFFMPVFALLLKLLYIRRHQYYTEHLIFSIHVHTFAFLFSFIALWVDYFQDAISLTALSMLVIPIYLLFAMKVVYEQGWIKTIVKATFSCWVYISIMMLGSIFILIFSLL